MKRSRFFDDRTGWSFAGMVRRVNNAGRSARLYFMSLRRRNKILLVLLFVILFYWYFPSFVARVSDLNIPLPDERNTVHPNPALDRLIHSKLLVEQKRHSYLTVVSASYGHMDLTLNWIAGFNRCFGGNDRDDGGTLEGNYTNRFLVVAMDRRMYHAMRVRDLPCVLAEDLVVDDAFLPRLAGQALWREKEFILLSRLKLHILLPLMKHYSVDSIVFSDVDIVIKNSSLFGYLDNLPEDTQIAITSDNMNFQLYMCSCFYMIRNTPQVRALYEDFRTISLYYAEKSREVGWDDQELMNRYIPNMTNVDRLLFRLPLGTFPNGQALDANYPAKVNATPWIIHANYRVGQYTKICFLKKFNVWFLDFEWWFPWWAQYEFYLYFGVYQAMNFVGLTMWTV